MDKHRPRQEFLKGVDSRVAFLLGNKNVGKTEINISSGGKERLTFLSSDEVQVLHSISGSATLLFPKFNSWNRKFEIFQSFHVEALEGSGNGVGDEN